MTNLLNPLLCVQSNVSDFILVKNTIRHQRHDKNKMCKFTEIHMLI